MAHPLMPKATAVWLVENTALTFEQIAAFCGLHELEVQAIADDEVAVGMQGHDPIAGGELSQEELERCAGDSSAKLEMAKPNIPIPKARSKGARYTPVSKRQDRPDAIAWLVRNHPELSDAQISKLIGTTKPTINAVRERTHWNMPNIKPQNPVGLGLCLAPDLEKVVTLARARAGTVHESPAKPVDDAVEPSAPEAPAPGDAAPVTADEAPAVAIKFPPPGETMLLKGKAREEAELRAAKEAAALELAGPAAALEAAAAARAELPDPAAPNAPTTPEVLRAAEAIFAPPPVDLPEPPAEAAPKDEAEATPEPEAGETSEEDAEKAPPPSPETSSEDDEQNQS